MDLTQKILLATAVIYGLILLAMLWQNRKLNKSLQISAYANLFNSYSALMITAIERREFDKAFDHDDYYRVRAPEDKAIVHFFSVLVDLFDMVYTLYREKIIDDTPWISWENWLRYWLTPSDLCAFFLDAKDQYTKPFAEKVEDLLKQESAAPC